ncbi:hypothetical protein GCM10027419_14410 [Pandoraea terrae]
MYPYRGATATHMARLERQVFDIVATHVAQYLPEFDSMPAKQRALVLSMLRETVEKSPANLLAIVTEVLLLPAPQREMLADLLEDVSLASMISAARTVADRLKFLKGLETMIFARKRGKKLRERDQLHRIVAENCWLFGEEYLLSVSDRSLTEVLRAHQKLIGEDVLIDVPVPHISQTRGIVDLVLSKATRQHRPNSLSHLVIELKAPGTTLNSVEISQIEGYAFSLFEERRFRNVDVQWDFWLLGDDLGPHARGRILDADSGLIINTRGLKVHIKTWAQLIDANRARMQYLQERLEFHPDETGSLDYMYDTYAQYLNESACVSEPSAIYGAGAKHALPVG